MESASIYSHQNQTEEHNGVNRDRSAEGSSLLYSEAEHDTRIPLGQRYCHDIGEGVQPELKHGRGAAVPPCARASVMLSLKTPVITSP
jgi:hypothetical protein